MVSKLTVALSWSLHYLVEYLCLYSTAVGGSNLLLSLALVQGSAPSYSAYTVHVRPRALVVVVMLFYTHNLTTAMLSRHR